MASQSTYLGSLNPAQLAATVGASVRTSGTTVQSDCDQAPLDNALASYSYDAHWGEDQNIRTLRVLQSGASAGTLTAPQVQQALAAIINFMVPA